jgi:hypothetical protein
MAAMTSAPPDGGPAVFLGVNAQSVDGARRPGRPDRVHQRVVRILGHRRETRVEADGREQAEGDFGYPGLARLRAV